MEEKFDILDNLKKTAKPTVPAGYFDGFYSKLNRHLKEDEIELSKKSKPEVPADFFTNFSSDLMDKIKEQESTVSEPTKVWPLKLVGFITAVAACALIFFMLNPKEEAQLVADTDENVVPETEERHVDTYLAYLDEDEIVDFLLENEDIEISNEFSEAEEDEYYFLEEDIEELYREDL